MIQRYTFSTKVQNRWRGLTEGNPLAFAFAALMLCPGLTKKQVGASYKIVTGKGMDTRLSDVVGWALGWDGELEVAEPPSPAVSPAAVESNTEAILTLMDDLSAFKNEIRADVAQIGAGLESRLKDVDESLQHKSDELKATRKEADRRRKEADDLRTELDTAQALPPP